MAFLFEEDPTKTYKQWLKGNCTGQGRKASRPKSNANYQLNKKRRNRKAVRVLQKTNLRLRSTCITMQLLGEAATANSTENEKFLFEIISHLRARNYNIHLIMKLFKACWKEQNVILKTDAIPTFICETNLLLLQ